MLKMSYVFQQARHPSPEYTTTGESNDKTLNLFGGTTSPPGGGRSFDHLLLRYFIHDFDILDRNPCVGGHHRTLSSHDDRSLCWY